MQSNTVVVAAVTAIAAFMLLWGQIARADSYPLTCKSGTTYWSYNSVNHWFTAAFQKSAQPASGGLAPSQCSWTDRGMRGDDPNVLCADIGNFALSVQTGHVTWTDFKDHTYANGFLTSTDRIYVFQVHKEGACLKIDHYGP